MPKYVIEQDREGCTGCGVCASLCPDNWVMADDGLSDPVNSELEELGCNMDAAQSCPVLVIHIYELKDGEREQLI